MWHTYCDRRTAFTLVELLVVVAIVGLLIALLLPAIQSARESARALTCNNKVKQLALGWHTHHSLDGHFPTGGWHGGYPTFAPDADRGFGKRQPGTWTFNVLPYIEQGSLRDLGKGKTRGNFIDSDAFRVWFSHPIPDLLCPTRGRRVVESTDDFNTYMPRPRNISEAFWESMDRTRLAVSDYVANQASITNNSEDSLFPKSYADADSPGFPWLNIWNKHGVCFYRSAIRTSDLEDGSSNIYMLGERHIPTACHFRIALGTRCGSSAYFYYDTAQFSLSADSEKAVSLAIVSSHGQDPPVEEIWPIEWRPPVEDFTNQDPGMTVEDNIFGSSHPHSFHMSFCDGSVRRISYDIDPLTHIRLGYRDDGVAVDMSKLE